MMDFLTALALRPGEISNDDIAYGRETIDLDQLAPYLPMLDQHARELRGMATRINLEQYKKLQQEGRLLVIGARRKDNGAPVGYSINIWYDDLHFGLRLGLDDAWFVFPQYRRRGIGRRLREVALDELRKIGVKIALARTKYDQQHDHVMAQLGYRPYEIVYRKDL
jgi:GNAT superfamily N-acetyltransferase